MSDQLDMGLDVPVVPVVVLSADQRRTIAQRAMLAQGRHPANGLPIITTGQTCNDCVNLTRYLHHNRTYLKCPEHRLGESHSAASDVRASWPACTKFQPKGEE